MNTPQRREAGIVFAACLALIQAGYADGKSLQSGENFPDLKAFALEGELPDLAAARVVIVDFWASWCAPCKASFPVFDELQREYGARGLVVVAVSVDQNVKAMRSFLDRAKPAFSVVRDAGQKLAKEVSPPAMPTSYVIDGKGLIRFVHEGFHGAKSRTAYIEEIEGLLKEAP